MGATPFIYGKTAERSEFTNRRAEVKRLHNIFNSLTNTILISPRRWGKTSLVKRASTSFQKVNKKTKVCYIDLYNIKSEEEFYKVYAEAVIRASSGRIAEAAKNVTDFLKGLMPRISYSPDAWQEFSIGLNWSEVKKSPSKILNLPERICKTKRIKMIICMDEFQDISLLKKSTGFQKTLRAHWQHHQHCCYCLYGSKRNMMTEIFNKSSMPFYNFGDILFLEKIKLSDWQSFIVRRFKRTGKSITRGQAKKIGLSVDCHPYYVQQLAQAVWLRTEKDVENELIDVALNSLVDQMSHLFENLAESLSKKQIGLLMAIADGETLLNATKTLQKYDLGTSGNVSKLKKALLRKDLIDIHAGKITIQNPLFVIWLRRLKLRGTSH